MTDTPPPTAKPLPQQALRKQGHPRAVAAREKKRADAAAIGIDADYISAFVDAFYGAIRQDALLGPIFAARIADWPPHLARMKQFWRSILLSSGEYTGNPMQQHLQIAGLEAAHFVRWLELFHATLTALESDPRATRETTSRARMIADSLLTGIAMRDSGIAGARAGEALPRF